MTNDLGERRDLADERDEIEYKAMCDTVRAEAIADAEEHGYVCHRPNEACVHREAMRRLKEKYESACGE